METNISYQREIAARFQKGSSIGDAYKILTILGLYRQ